MTDEQFKQALTDYLAQFSEGRKPIVPLKSLPNGKLDRKGTLSLPCYHGFPLRNLAENGGVAMRERQDGE